jgi:hypothetical protein
MLSKSPKSLATVVARFALVAALGATYVGCTQSAPHATLITVTTASTGTATGPAAASGNAEIVSGPGPTETSGTGSGTGTATAPGSGGAGTSAAQSQGWDGKSTVGNALWNITPNQ